MEDFDITVTYKDGVLNADIVRISDEAELSFSTTNLAMPMEVYAELIKFLDVLKPE